MTAAMNVETKAYIQQMSFWNKEKFRIRVNS